MAIFRILWPGQMAVKCIVRDSTQESDGCSQSSLLQQIEFALEEMSDQYINTTCKESSTTKTRLSWTGRIRPRLRQLRCLIFLNIVNTSVFYGCRLNNDLVRRKKPNALLRRFFSCKGIQTQWGQTPTSGSNPGFKKYFCNAVENEISSTKVPYVQWEVQDDGKVDAGEVSRNVLFICFVRAWIHTWHFEGMISTYPCSNEFEVIHTVIRTSSVWAIHCTIDRLIWGTKKSRHPSSWWEIRFGITNLIGWSLFDQIGQ